jgi:hypothetical protein
MTVGFEFLRPLFLTKVARIVLTFLEVEMTNQIHCRSNICQDITQLYNFFGTAKGVLLNMTERHVVSCSLEMKDSRKSNYMLFMKSTKSKLVQIGYCLRSF